jgi:carbamoyltransferase
MNILGIHGGITINQHDAGAALIKGGELICCVEEERLIRVKSPKGVLPIESIAACLKEGGLSMRDVDLVALPGETYADIEVRTQAYLMHHFGFSPPVKIINHQLAHLASSFFPSGFLKAMCLSYDAYGDRLSAAMGVADIESGVKVIETRPHENSLGMFYATMTSFLGFMPGEDEYKVMGLAPYGKDKIDLSFFAQPCPEGYFVDTNLMRHSPPPGSAYEQFYSESLVKNLGEPRRKGVPLTQRHRNIAAGTQEALEKCAVSLVTYLHEKTGHKDLCLAGGVALNCTLNGVLSNLPFIENIFVQPAASDRGLALGCALQAAKEAGEFIKPIQHVFYGPSQNESEITSALALSGMTGVHLEDPSIKAAQLLSEGKIVGWFQGRSEYGPRALGHRSILAHPGLLNMKNEINARVKYREEFRPFAPSVLSEKASEVFHIKKPSPFMTIAFEVRKDWVTKLPATTHVNNSARVQTVSKEDDYKYHSLISHFEKLTGLPVVLNTSFNIKGQPIVETPLDALSTFAGTGMDALIMGNFLLEKSKEPRVKNL